MKNFILAAGYGFAIRKIAPVIASKIGYVFDKWIKVFADKLKGADEWLEEKTGIDLLSPEFQRKYDAIVNHAVEFTEAVFTDPAKIRFVLNKILRGDASVKPEDLKDWAGIGWKKFLASLPEDLKASLSMEKEDFAAQLVKEMMEKLTGTPVSEGVVRSSIKAMVTAKNTNQAKIDEHFKEESFTALWERLTRESEKRQEALK